jgi:CDP-diglyceride synthetase
MIFVRTPLLKSLAKPLDGGLVLSDGKRLFGDNKTWKGLIGMVALTAFCAVLLHIYPKDGRVFQYPSSGVHVMQQTMYGAMLGLAYILAELPNSFIKRRLNIAPGKNATGMKGILFTIIDQLDSVIGGTIVISLFMPIRPITFIISVAIAAAIHYAVNILLYLAKLKSQAR